MTTDELLQLGTLMNRPITITRGPEVARGTLMGLSVSYLHSSGPHVSLHLEGFVSMTVKLQAGDVVELA